MLLDVKAFQAQQKKLMMVESLQILRQGENNRMLEFLSI